MMLTDTYEIVQYRKNALGLTWTDIAEKMGIRHMQNAMDAARRGTLPENFVRLCDALGCDVAVVLFPHDLKMTALEKSVLNSLYGKMATGEVKGEEHDDRDQTE